MKLEPNQLSRNQLVNDHLPLVKNIIYKMSIYLSSSLLELDDLMNAGVFGLIGAIERYDPKKGNNFKKYAAYCIKGAVLEELRALDYLSRDSRRKVKKLEYTYLKLENKMGREIKDEEQDKKENSDYIRRCGTAVFIYGPSLCRGYLCR